MNSLLVLLISFVDANVSCVACEVNLIETPDDGIRVERGDRRCAETGIVRNFMRLHFQPEDN